ncbi:MAG: EamA family transporter [Clostridia bacterium]|nr:EamA family transporter [Clostridia bacterium]
MFTFGIILILCIVASSKVTIQGAVAKKNVRNQADAILFNGLIFAFASVLFLPKLFTSPVSAATVVCGLIMGVLSVMFQWSYVQAMSSGPVSMTVLINNFSMLMPVLLSVFFYSESFGLFRILGLILMLLSFLIDVRIDKNSKPDRFWFLMTMLTFCSNGLMNVVIKIFSMSRYQGEITGYVSIAYLTATALSLLLFLFFRGRGIRNSFSVDRRVLLCAFGAGILLAIAQALNAYASAHIEGTFFFPVYNGGVTITIAMIGLIFFRETFPLRKWIGLIIGVSAIILMSF